MRGEICFSNLQVTFPVLDVVPFFQQKTTDETSSGISEKKLELYNFYVMQEYVIKLSYSPVVGK